MNTEQERAEFEAWHKEKYDSTFYCEAQWKGWQARAALQSQDREDAERFRFCLKHGFPKKWEEMIRGSLRYYWTSRPGSQEEFSSAVDAIDHARRIEWEEMRSKDFMSLMPEVLAALKATGQNVSLVQDLEAAIEADRQRRGEPVGHVVQPSPAHFPGVYWLSEVHDGMELYAAPQPADPVVKESLTAAEPVKVPKGYVLISQESLRQLLGERQYNEIVGMCQYPTK